LNHPCPAQVDARFFAVEPGSDPAAGDAGVAALVAFVAAKRPALEVLVVEGSHAILADAAPLDALSRHPRLTALSLAHANVDRAALAPLLRATGFDQLKKLARTTDDDVDDRVLAARGHAVSLKPFAHFGSDFGRACRRARVRFGLPSAEPAS